MGITISPDYSEATEFTPLPAGTYKARIIDCQGKKSQAGNELAEWVLTTFGSDNQNLNNRKIWHTTPVTGKGAGFLKALVRAATGEEPQPGPFNSDILMGRTISITVEEGRNQVGELTGFPRVKAVEALKG